MPWALIIIGLVLVRAGMNDKVADLENLLVGDFQSKNGSPSFIYWVGAIGIIGAIGYVPKAQTVSRSFLLLVIIVMFLSNQGFFAQFSQALQGFSATANTSEAANGAANTDPGVSASNTSSIDPTISDLINGNYGSAILREITPQPITNLTGIGK